MKGLPISETNSDPADPASVYVVPIDELHKYAPPWFIEGRPIRALAAHPERDDLVYLTTDAPDSLAFLPDHYVELE